MLIDYQTSRVICYSFTHRAVETITNKITTTKKNNSFFVYCVKIGVDDLGKADRLCAKDNDVPELTLHCRRLPFNKRHLTLTLTLILVILSWVVLTGAILFGQLKFVTGFLV